MKKSLASKILIMITTTAVITLLSVLITLNIYNKQIAKDNLNTMIKILEDILVDENINTVEGYKKFASVKNMNSNFRITILSIDGFAIADTFISNIEEMPFENQSQKTEVVLASRSHSEIEYAIRNSDMSERNFLYAAKVVHIDDDSSVILRICTPLSYINRYVIGFSIAVVVIMVLLLFIPMLVFLPKLITGILKPFEMMKNNLNSILENNFHYTKSITKYDELNTVLEEINEVSHKLKANIQENEKEKHKLNYVLDNINQGLIALDENDHIVFINSFSLKLLDVSDFGSKYLIEVIRDRYIESCIQKAIKDRTYITLEYTPTSSTSNAILKIEVLPVYEGLHSLIKISDITEIKKLEIEKNELFTNASHKLNTPLTSIIGYSDILLLNESKRNNNTLDDTNNIAQNNFIARINDQAKKMKSLIADMLELTKYQKGFDFHNQQHKDYKNPVDINAIVKDVVDKMTIIAKQKSVKINVALEDDLLVFGNTNHIEEAIENLLDNAIKYNQQNGSVHISAKRMGEKIIFTISDKGIGIPQEYVNRIFERFFRVSNESTKNIDGSGIGLAIVKHVCMSCNASIHVSSIENVGTDITIEFQKYKD